MSETLWVVFVDTGKAMYPYDSTPKPRVQAALTAVSAMKDYPVYTIRIEPQD